MEIINAILWSVFFYFIFKLGEHYAYFKIARGLKNFKEHAKLLTVDRANGIMEVEKIGEQYYAYVDNTFVGQGNSLDEVKQIAQRVIEKNPERYAGIMVRMKE